MSQILMYAVPEMYAKSKMHAKFEMYAEHKNRPYVTNSNVCTA